MVVVIVLLLLAGVTVVQEAPGEALSSSTPVERVTRAVIVVHFFPRVTSNAAVTRIRTLFCYKCGNTSFSLRRRESFSYAAPCWLGRPFEIRKVRMKSGRFSFCEN